MRRYSKEELKNKKRSAAIMSVVLVLIAVFWCFFPYLFPAPKYDELNEKTVTIHKYVIWSGKGPDGHYIYATDGEIYALTGDYANNLTKAYLVPGEEVTIKWYKWLLSYCAEEVVVDGRPVVWYDNDTVVLWPGILMCGMTCFLNLLCSGISWYEIRRIEELQAKRDKRIEKKYGKKKNEKEPKVP